MGYTTCETDIKEAIALSKNYGDNVIEASKIDYFKNNNWVNLIKKAEIGDNNRIYFTLDNNDFVVVEKS